MTSGDTIRRVLTIDGHRLAVLEGNPHAAGPPVVFLHGILGSIDFWLPLLTPAVKQSRHWISLGLPGHFPGRLPAQFDAPSFTSPAWAELLAQAIRRLANDEAVDLVGYSTGGFAALNLAAQRPQSVRSVLTVAGFADGRWNGSLGFLQSLASRGPLGAKLFTSSYRSLVRSPWLFRRCLLANAAGRIDVRSPQVARILAAAHSDASRQDPLAMASLVGRIRRFDIRALLARIAAPVAIVAGDRDPVIRYSHACELAAAIPQARLITLAGVGHLFQIECADRFAGVLDRWLRKEIAPVTRDSVLPSSAACPQHAA